MPQNSHPVIPLCKEKCQNYEWHWISNQTPQNVWDLILEAYSRESFARLAPKLVRVHQSTDSTGEVLNAPRHS